MNPTDILKNEHRIIEVVLQALEAMSAVAEHEHTLDAADANQAVDFLRNFADRCHHGKEEVHFFTQMELHGFPRDGGPTGVMIYEHEQSRAHVRKIAASIIPAANGDNEALDCFVTHANAYIQLLRDHIQKEDHCLFPMADNAFSEADQQLLLQKFEQTEREDIGEGVHETFVAAAKSLAGKYHVDLSHVDANCFQCGCHHG